jgi:hypothetical protein
MTQINGVTKPYKRTARAFMNGDYYEGLFTYLRHPAFAKDGVMYIRAFMLLQKDLQTLFEYIEPADQNLQCYSFRIQELLLRTCVEAEANFKAVLRENEYRPGTENKWNMKDYSKIDRSHHLSSFEVKLPVWHGQKGTRKPFQPWAVGRALPWYRAYNDTKHDRHEGFTKATFDHLIDAICGLVAVLSAQFVWESERKPSEWLDSPIDFVVGVGRYFSVRFPGDWKPEDRYNFRDEWHTLEREADPFQTFVYA